MNCQTRRVLPSAIENRVGERTLRMIPPSLIVRWSPRVVLR
jgi:hypothetical protein